MEAELYVTFYFFKFKNYILKFQKYIEKPRGSIWFVVQTCQISIQTTFYFVLHKKTKFDEFYINQYTFQHYIVC
jgi:hypothetical protein